jgi:hypothetical protein
MDMRTRLNSNLEIIPMRMLWNKNEFERVYEKGNLIRSFYMYSYLNRNGTTVYTILLNNNFLNENEITDTRKYRAYSVSTIGNCVQLQSTAITQTETDALKKMEAIKNENCTAQEKQNFEEAINTLNSISTNTDQTRVTASILSSFRHIGRETLISNINLPSSFFTSIPSTSTAEQQTPEILFIAPRRFENRGFSFIDTFFNTSTSLYSISGNLDLGIEQSLQQSLSTTALPPTLGVKLWGANYQKLKDINPDTCVPEKYCCSLSATIMTNPVYDPKHPQYKFEKDWILRALQTKLENPFTRTPLVPNDLVDDTDLKAKIDSFLEEEKKKQNNQPSTSANLK